MFLMNSKNRSAPLNENMKIRSKLALDYQDRYNSYQQLTNN